MAAGVAIDRETSMTRAIGEAVERYSAAHYNVDDLPLTCFKDATFACVPPDEFALYSPHQFKQQHFPYRPFTVETLLRWSPSVDLSTGEIVHVPAAMIYQPYHYDKRLGETSLFQQMSTGLASHSNPSLAALTAIYEVVERDAVSITWQAQIQPPQIPIESLSPENRAIVNRLERPGAEIRLLYLTLDHNIPVVLAAVQTSTPDSPAMAVAAAAHLDPDRAIRKSLEELGQTWAFARWLNATRPHFNPGKRWERVLDPEAHALVYCSHAYTQHAQFLFSSNERICAGDIPSSSNTETTHALRSCIDKIAQTTHRVLLADVTPDDIREIGLFVMRAIIPGFHPLFMGHMSRALGGNRLWKIPQRCGHIGISRDRGDNPCPHPFP